MKEKTKKLVALGLSALMVVGFAGCSGGSESSDSDTIKVGVNYELTGDVAVYGNTSVNGIKLAVEEINANGGVDGKQIELVEYDNKSDSSEAMTVATKLATQDQVCVMLGPATSGAFSGTNSIAAENKVPALSGSATADNVTVNEDGSVNEYLFRLCFNDSYQGTVMASFAKDNLKAKTALIISDTADAYSNGLATAFEQAFKDGGGKIVAKENYTTGDKDFNSVLTKIQNKKYDVIYLPAYYTEASLIIKQARDLGIDVPFLGPDGYDSETMVETAGADALNNVYFTNHYAKDDEAENVQNFIKAYKEKYNEDPSAFSALGYDMGYFVADAIKRAGEVNGEKIQQAMASTEGFEGITGTVTIDENHNPIKSTIVIEFKDGKQAFNSRVEAE